MKTMGHPRSTIRTTSRLPDGRSPQPQILSPKSKKPSRPDRSEDFVVYHPRIFGLMMSGLFNGCLHLCQAPKSALAQIHLWVLQTAATTYTRRAGNRPRSYP